jgi:hypothetical protein
MHFDLISVLWGEKYVDVFLDLILPNYLSKNNIPLACKKYMIASKIYTTAEEAERIQSHFHFKKLQEFIDVQVFPIIDLASWQTKDKYKIKGTYASIGIRNAIANQSVGLFFSADCLIADGGLEKCCSLIAEGKKAILIAGFSRAGLESIRPALKEHYDPETGSLTLPSRRLIELGIQHSHPNNQFFYWDAQPFTNWPSIIYWKAGEKSLLVKSFHLHPLTIDLRNVRKDFPEVLMPEDGGLIDYLKIPQKERHIVTNSDEIACVELTSCSTHLEDISPVLPQNKSLYMINWTRRYTSSADKRSFYKFNLRFQGDENVDWQKLERQVNQKLFWVKSYLITINVLRFIAEKLGIVFLKRKANALIPTMKPSQKIVS